MLSSIKFRFGFMIMSTGIFMIGDNKESLRKVLKQINELSELVERSREAMPDRTYSYITKKLFRLKTKVLNKLEPKILFYDLYSGRYFYSSIADVTDKASVGTMNHFYREVGLSEIGEAGEKVIGYETDIYFTINKRKEDGLMFVTVEFENREDEEENEKGEKQ